MIRKLITSDLASYKTLRLLSLQTDPLSFFARFEEAKKWSDRQFEAEFIGAYAGIFGYYGYFVDNMLVGYICLSPISNGEHQTADVYNLYVLPQFRRQGIAKKLLEYIIDQAQAEKLTTLFLSVMDHNEGAISLYKHYQFYPYDSRKDVVRHGDEFLTEILMRKDLDSL
ncbi:hypothetical protein C5B42_04545 [Candidatus Cerribacteria bacterium 'Amazon FNV 2010 28 9']|uniref:N-acetyltransferase domain-containing protein n=1 Tax=Candidatus Cerribacteria bacterium 'Amazon FNV 2010 28 9' TaxID=2081795 RepID=A0A317JT04_9BACT|nr:MAG: hypothetical protein C5B42_04545 [Candidatus Cerribacteria bacterium 'Amazon FNV 2010 28 9']